MVNCTFEGTPFFRTLLKEEFGLKEIYFQDNGVKLYLWKHPWYRELISTPFRDRLAIEMQDGSNEKLNLDKVISFFGDTPLDNIESRYSY